MIEKLKIDHKFSGLNRGLHASQEREMNFQSGTDTQSGINCVNTRLDEVEYEVDGEDFYNRKVGNTSSS